MPESVSPSARTQQVKAIGPVAVATILTVGLAAAQSSGRSYIPAAFLIVSLPLVVISAQARLMVLTFGGLLAFQSTAGLSLLKLTYFGVAVIALLAGLATVSTRSDRKAIKLIKPMIITAAIFVAVVILSLPVALVGRTALSDWLRDAAPYLLFCTVPVFALDFGSFVSRRSLIAVFITIGILATLSFAIEWAGANRRNFIHLPINHLLLPSALLPTALICFTSSSAIFAGRRGRIWWIALTVSMIAVLALVTGTRSLLVLFFVPLIVSLAGPRPLLGRTLRVAVTTALAVAVGLSLTLLVLRVAGTNPLRLLNRLASLAQLLIHPSQDSSYQQRQQEFDSAFATFRSSPLIGAGPGHLFHYRDYYGATVSSFNVDSGMEFLAKFGLVGLAVLAAVSIALIVVLSRTARIMRAETSWTSLAGFAVISAVFFLFGSPIEDKGFSFGMILVLSLLLADYRNHIEAQYLADATVPESRSRGEPSSATTFS